MEISKLLLGHTFHADTEELSGLAQKYLLDKPDTIFFAVELKIFGIYVVHEFSDLQSMLEHSQHHNIVYRFIEYTNIEAKRRILVVHNVMFSNKIFGYQNFYGIGECWKLYVNSKSDIVVQHIKFPQIDITVRFRNFPEGNDFYFYLSCLIYVLTNYKLDTEKEIKSTFEEVRSRNRTE